jgi:threonine/homoserine/homoserine lactone efflux protein
LLNSVIKDGPKAGVAFGIAHGLGIFVYAALVASGLVILLSVAPWFSIALELIGLFFLLWLSISMIKNSLQKGSIDETGSDSSSATLLKHGRNGFLIVFLNPKIAVFFLAIFSQFLDAASDLESKIIMVITATVIDGVWYILLTFVIAVPKFTKLAKLSVDKIEFFLGALLLLVSFVLSGNIIMVVF